MGSACHVPSERLSFVFSFQAGHECLGGPANSGQAEGETAVGRRTSHPSNRAGGVEGEVPLMCSRVDGPERRKRRAGVHHLTSLCSPNSLCRTVSSSSHTSRSGRFIGPACKRFLRSSPDFRTSWFSIFPATGFPASRGRSVSPCSVYGLRPPPPCRCWRSRQILSSCFQGSCLS